MSFDLETIALEIVCYLKTAYPRARERRLDVDTICTVMRSVIDRMREEPGVTFWAVWTTGEKTIPRFRMSRLSREQREFVAIAGRVSPVDGMPSLWINAGRQDEYRRNEPDCFLAIKKDLGVTPQMILERELELPVSEPTGDGAGPRDPKPEPATIKPIRVGPWSLTKTGIKHEVIDIATGVTFRSISEARSTARQARQAEIEADHQDEERMWRQINEERDAQNRRELQIIEQICGGGNCPNKENSFDEYHCGDSCKRWSSLYPTLIRTINEGTP